VTIRGKDQEAASIRPRRKIRRWECDCQEPPVLLATYDESGAINIKARDRYWTVHGTVQARCPLCGREHTLDLEQGDAAV
jgi:hypothetical protein